MTDDLWISLPESCSERWEDMAPRGCNRHCASCDLLIHDLAAMTAEEAEALLDRPEKVCVRARIGPGGQVRTADSSTRHSRRIMAAVGTSMTLAAAACQTTPQGPGTRGYEISGLLTPQSLISSASAHSSDGRSYVMKLDRHNGFRVRHLLPGTYTLTFDSGCDAAPHEVENVVVADHDVDLGRLDVPNECIIIGVMTRDPRSGENG